MRRRPANATVPEPASQQNSDLRWRSMGEQPPRSHGEHHRNRNAVERATNNLTAFRAVAIRYWRDYSGKIIFSISNRWKTATLF